MTPDQLRIEFAERLGFKVVDASFECLPSPWPGCGVGPPASMENESNWFRLVQGVKFIVGFRWWNFKKPEMLWPGLKDCISSLPNPTSHTDVHNALMGMSEGEWIKFGDLLWRKFPDVNNPALAIILAFKTPLSTLVECFLEATKGRVK